MNFVKDGQVSLFDTKENWDRVAVNLQIWKFQVEKKLRTSKFLNFVCNPSEIEPLSSSVSKTSFPITFLCIEIELDIWQKTTQYISNKSRRPWMRNKLLLLYNNNNYCIPWTYVFLAFYCKASNETWTRFLIKSTINYICYGIYRYSLA